MNPFSELFLPLEPVSQIAEDVPLPQLQSRRAKRRHRHRKRHQEQTEKKEPVTQASLEALGLPPDPDCLTFIFFEKEFGKAKGIEMGEYKIGKPGQKLVTRGTSTCISVAAVAFNHCLEVSLLGLAHFTGEDPDLSEFFAKMTVGDVAQVKVTLVGGQGKNPEEDPNCRLVTQCIRDNPLIQVEKVIFNPWEVPDDWQDLHLWKMINPSAAIGVYGDGKVVVSDETDLFFRNSVQGFTKFNEALSILQKQEAAS